MSDQQRWEATMRDWERGSAMHLRDTFAAAALTGLLAAPTDKDRSSEYWARFSYEIADAMLRERERTTHDAAPAARARTDADRGRTDKADSRPGAGTGDTPVTEPMPVFVSGSGSVTPVSYAETDAKRVDWHTVGEPVAWAVPYRAGEPPLLISDYDRARTVANRCGCGLPRPLYRQPQPTITDAERVALREAADAYGDNNDDEGSARIEDALRGLLERLE